MKTLHRPTNYVLILGFSALLSSCSGDSGNAYARTDDLQTRDTNIQQDIAACNNCGTVVDIEKISNDGDSSGIGAAIGAVVGGLAGHQVGGGNGKKVATAAGVAGGALAGNKIEKARNGETYYKVSVVTEAGDEKQVVVPSVANIDIGTKVRVQDGDLILI